MDTSISKKDNGEVEVDFVDNVNFLEIGGYGAKESVNDVTIGDNLSHEQRAEFMDLANEFQGLSYSPKPQAQQVWLSIISSLHPTNQLDRDHIQYHIA